MEMNMIIYKKCGKKNSNFKMNQIQKMKIKMMKMKMKSQIKLEVKKHGIRNK